MITMKFEEMKKIWDEQNQQSLYAINEEALHDHTRAKKQSAKHTSNFSEIFLIIANIAATAIILVSSFIKNNGNIYIYVLAGLMVITAVFVFVGRMRRKKRESNFEQSMLGDLNHAIANAAFQVRLSQIMRWYILPVGVLTTLAVWQNETQIWVLFLILLFFGIAWLAGGWEHRVYVRKKRELESLHKKLKEESNEN